jgi:hypothetical protein
MPKFKVSVEKKEYRTGSVTVNANNADAAIEKVKNRIDKGKLQTTDIEWGDAQYEDCSFATTGDVD